MEINKLLNFISLPLILIALILIYPPFLVFKLLSSIQSFVFKENVAGKVVLITGASSGIGKVCSFCTLNRVYNYLHNLFFVVVVVSGL